jgi:hypothetical protein
LPWARKTVSNLNTTMEGFGQFLLETQGMGVPFLYPLGYQGVGQYPPQYLTALFPDALIYIAADERLQHCWEAEPFKIDHLKPQPIFNKAYGKLSLVSTHPELPPGNSVPWKALPPDPDVKPFPEGPAHPCMISEPKCLPGNLIGKDAEKFGDPCHGNWNLPENKGENIMKKYIDYMEAKKMSKGNSEKYKRIECEDCERVYDVPNAEYENRRVERSRMGKYIQFPDEDCPYCRHEKEMDDDDMGQRRARYGDHTGYAEGTKKEYAPLVGARPDQVGNSRQQMIIPDEFPSPSIVTDKTHNKKRNKMTEHKSFFDFVQMMEAKKQESQKVLNMYKKDYDKYQPLPEKKGNKNRKLKLE